jgi:hypothetical protein
VPSFFVPFARTADVAEETYRSLAEWCGARAPEDPSDRICAITWVRNGAEWTATVGDELRGIVPERIRSTGRIPLVVATPRSWRCCCWEGHLGGARG